MRSSADLLEEGELPSWWRHCSRDFRAWADQRRLNTPTGATYWITEAASMAIPLAEYFRWLSPEPVKCVRGKDRSRVTAKEAKEALRGLRRVLKCTFLATDRSVSLFKHPDMIEYRRNRAKDRANDQDLWRMIEAANTPEGRRHARQAAKERSADANEYFAELKMDEVAMLLAKSIATLAPEGSAEAKARNRYAIVKCREATGFERESRAALLTGYIALGKASVSRVDGVDRVRMPKIGLDAIAKYLVTDGQIGSMRSLEKAHSWMYENLPKLFREFYEVENPAILGPTYAEMKKREEGISDAEWLYKHLGWGQAEATRRSMTRRKPGATT